MKEIYLVTQGSYSDYGVRGVFVDKELATEYAAQITNKYDAARVETRPIMTELTTPIGYRGYEVTMDIDGNTDELEPTEVGKWDEDSSYAEYEYTSNDTDDWRSGGKHITTGRYHFFVNTDKGPEGAIKIANERRIRMIAENKWPKQGLIAEQYEN